MDNAQGIVSDISYRNEENGYTVLKLQCEDSDRRYTCVGTMPTVERGQSIKIRGRFENHIRYGPQLVVEGYEFVRPTTTKGIYMLLSSGLIQNIGQVRAERIIAAFGKETLDILDHHSERLREVEGIGKKTVEAISTAWNRQRHLRELVLFLQEFGITVDMVGKIYKAYGDKAKEAVSANPYGLIDDIWGVGFKKADAIAEKLGYEKESYRRIRAGIIHVLKEGVGDGHVYLPRNELTEKAGMLLGVSDELVVYSLDNAINQKAIMADEDRVYLPGYYWAEVRVAEMIAERVAHGKKRRADTPEAEFDRWIGEYANRTDWKGDPLQIEAVKSAVSGAMLLLTGGPGTGKTTTLNVIVSFFREYQCKVVLAAPTGRAAQRMGGVAGLSAKTIHRLLEYRPRKDGSWFGRGNENPLDLDVLIIDEVSMIDLMLMQHLLSAIPPDAVLILVGDSNQLPSVGAGNVLADLIHSGQIPHVTLTTIFRQALQSRIVMAAHDIMHGTIPFFENGSSDDCFFLKREGPEECFSTIVEIVSQRLPKRYNFDPIRDIQVLSPMHRGPLGTVALNHALQQKLNPGGNSVLRGEVRYAVGDKVMQVKNNYDREVFNGDIGFIARVLNEDGGVLVDFDGRSVSYELTDLDELTHAYAVSIHKSQGCEFRAVVLPVMTQHYIMLQRNLVYTAITRARSLCVIVGMPRAFRTAVLNEQTIHRFSHLSEKIRHRLNELMCVGGLTSEDR